MFSGIRLVTWGSPFRFVAAQTAVYLQLVRSIIAKSMSSVDFNFTFNLISYWKSLWNRSLSVKIE
jgi:hypothetical protein